jgi:hypothetical protein
MQKEMRWWQFAPPRKRRRAARVPGGMKGFAGLQTHGKVDKKRCKGHGNQ